MTNENYILIPGNQIDVLRCESYYDKVGSRIRIRPLEGQGLPTNIRISCSMAIRGDYPVGTQFIAYNVRIMHREGEDTVYLRVLDLMLYKTG